MWIRKIKTTLLCWTALSTFLLLCACNKLPEPAYYTWEGIGPDKWASIWFINRFVDNKAAIRLVPVNQKVANATAFDIPPAKYKRTSEHSTLAAMLQDFEVHDPVLEQIAQIIHDIEVNYWGSNEHDKSVYVEREFRAMQLRYGRDAVPQGCYVTFFENLYRALARAQERSLTTGEFVRQLRPDSACAGRQVAFIQKPRPALVAVIDIESLLLAMRAGEKVVFVDAREADEYDEFRIPNAINLRLRDVDESVAPLFSGADRVIAYCLKDFRGFELARALQEKAGVKNAAIMKPYGINGWRALGLPVEGSKALSHELALARIDECLADVTACLRK